MADDSTLKREDAIGGRELALEPCRPSSDDHENALTHYVRYGALGLRIGPLQQESAGGGYGGERHEPDARFLSLASLTVRPRGGVLFLHHLEVVAVGADDFFEESLDLVGEGSPSAREPQWTRAEIPRFLSVYLGDYKEATALL